MLQRRRTWIVALGILCAAGSLVAEEAATQGTPWTTSRIVGSPETPEPYRVVPAFPKLKFQKPTSIEELPGTNRLLITEMSGKIFSFPNDQRTQRPDLVGDLKELLPKELTGQGVSLFDAEPHPQFAENRQIYVCYVHPGTGRQTRVSRFTLTKESPPRIAPDSEAVIITWPSGGHNGGCLEFGKDGFLYISTGDGSGPNPPDGLTTGQDVTDLLGAILRIDVDRKTATAAYAIPSDNPFVSNKDARPEIWAYGLRNPWKFGTDPETNEVFAADNGWESWEMVHRIVRGGNCGWPIMEGRAALRTEVQPGPTPIIPPVKDHPHSEANSVIGGPVYRGNKLPGLVGSFVYGDYITGTIWSVRQDKAGGYSHTTLCDTDQQIVAFTEGSRGELWVLDYDFSGQIFELLPNDVPDTSATFPRRLSETGLFASLDKMQPAAGVVPYSVKVNRWLDGATAQRWIAVPGNGQARLSLTDEPSEFPEGTVLVKHLTLPQGKDGPAIRLETQILQYERGTWRPYSYLWNEAGQDAELVDSTGARRTLKVADGKTKDGVIERTWHVNAVNECKLCHNAGARSVLGFVPQQLTTQLETLTSLGVLTKTTKLEARDAAHLVDPHDPSQKLDDRARSYLHVNCSMCHHPRGNAIVSFYLRRDMPFEKLNTNKGTGIGTFGMQHAKIIAAGDPYRSVLLYRMSKLGYARMPYIGSRLVDGLGMALVEEWIKSLPTADKEGSPPLKTDSAEAQALQLLTDKKLESATARESAVQTLVKSTEGSLALLGQMHRGNLSAEAQETAVALGAAAKADVRGLFETFVPESQRRPTLGPKFDPELVLVREGDLGRGKLIFFSDGARCRNCHEREDRSQSVGPTIQEINKKYPRPAELLQHVVQPSLKIEEPFTAYAVLTEDGRSLVGLLAEQSDKEVVLKTAEKKLIRLPRSEIAQMKKSDKSLMPDQILSDLTAQEAADLFAYLRSLGAPK